MYELIKVGESSYYIDCPAKIGVYKADDKSVYLIDSGNDKDTGRKVRQILENNGWTLAAILNTHSNADHIGGNRYLQTQTGCKIFANGIEADFTRHPILEPSFLYGGYPCKDLRHKFLLAQESDARDFNDPDFPKEIGVIPLPGHFFDMVGFRTPDDTVFLADCISSRDTLEKYGIPFLY
ncbi:MAG: MBL fold metallo-hydrolase, partial [Clostridia bacterium]|nr:MBL fold metallo-hydrolase [Clostridia bacterium]